MFIGMPKIAKELSALEVKRLTRPGWHAVGGVATSKSRSAELVVLVVKVLRAFVGPCYGTSVVCV